MAATALAIAAAAREETSMLLQQHTTLFFFRSLVTESVVNLNAMTQLKVAAARDGNHFNETIDASAFSRLQTRERVPVRFPAITLATQR